MFARRSVHAALWMLMVCLTKFALGQVPPFSSGSTGADGALNITAPGVTYFNPAALSLNPAIPNIFNFTTINIAAGSTLKFTEEAFHGPAFFLATGNVTISGTLDLSGGNGINPMSLQSTRLQSYAGSGGYGGGLGGGPSGIPAPLAGNGPGGGAAGTAGAPNGLDGAFTGNPYLIPLIGGSGGGGAFCASGFGSGGAAGGGAILIASSTSITISGTINASGGVLGQLCQNSGGGSGGAVRLMANTIAGSGTIVANGGEGHTGAQAGSGLIRLESLTLSYNGPTTSALTSTPIAIALPTSAPGSLTVTSINGTAINANPFSFPDATINTAGPVTVNVQAQYIPVGTIPKIYVYGQSGPDQTINCSALSGTLALSTCSASITFVTGGSRGFVKATW